MVLANQEGQDALTVHAYGSQGHALRSEITCQPKHARLHKALRHALKPMCTAHVPRPCSCYAGLCVCVALPMLPLIL